MLLCLQRSIAWGWRSNTGVKTRGGGIFQFISIITFWPTAKWHLAKSFIEHVLPLKRLVSSGKINIKYIMSNSFNYKDQLKAT